MAAIALWSLKIEPGKKFNYQVENDLRITNAALGAELVDETGRSTLKFSELQAPDSDDDDEEATEPTKTEYVLCSLTPGKIEQQILDLVLSEEAILEFEVVGKNPIYLTGNFIDQGRDESPFGDSDSEEDAYGLDEVSSDVEIDPAELGEDEEDRFEEVNDEEKPTGLKRRRESDAMDEDVAPAGDDKPLSKSQKKKLNKKMKGEDGKAVPTGGDEAAKPTSKAAKADSKASKPESKPASDAKDGKKKKESDVGEKPKSAGGKKELGSGLIIEDKVVGTGKAAKKGKKVSMRYIGKLTNGEKFDSNTKGAPFTFTLGVGEVIKGWDLGVVGMQVGGERIITVPPELGYGKRGSKPIPPNATLIFEVKLVEVK